MRYIEIPSPLQVPWARAFIAGECIVLIAKEAGKWHLSISCEDRYPTWDEIKQARYDLLPDNVTMAMLLPPRSKYVNIHPNCFHLYEIKKREIALYSC